MDSVDFDGKGSYKGSYVEQMHTLSKQLRLDPNTIWTGVFKAEDKEGSLNLRAPDVGVFTFVKGVQLNNSSFSSMTAHGLPMIATCGPLLD